MNHRSLPDALPPAGWRDDADLLSLCALLGGDEEARFVGGAVRDSLIGIGVKDIDIATIHPPQEVITRLKAGGVKVVPTGIAHGTVTAVLPRGPVEITTLRHDVATDGRRATIAFATDWREDAARRDFTMNALYAEPVTGRLHDWFGGRADLAERRVRFIGDARARIDEDHLRILRYFRFLARFGTPDMASEDYAACVEKAPTMMALSRERIADELLRLLATDDPVQALSLMVEGRIFAAIIPEIASDGIVRVRDLAARERQMGEGADGLLRLVALLPPDAVVAERVAARLKLSNRARARIATALGAEDADDPRALAYRIGVRGVRDRIALGRAFIPADGAMLADWTVPRLPISGGDLIARGLEAGPAVARMLRLVEARWIAAGYPGREETLAIVGQFLR